MLKLNYFLADIFILSAKNQPIKLSWRKIEWLLYFMIIYVINAHEWYSTIPTILAIGLFIFFILKTPYCTYIEKETIIVKQVFGSIKITDIKSIKPIEKTDLANTTRVLGNG